MSRQVFAANEEPSYSKLNAVSDQTVIVCTSGTRPSSPPEGMHIFETNTDLFARYNGTSWIYYPLGFLDSIGGSTGTGTSGPPYGIGGTATTVNGSEFTNIGLYSGHKYLYEGNLSVKCDADDTIFKLDVYVEGSALTGETRYIHCDITDRVYEIAFRTVYTALSTADHDFLLKLERFAGTGNAAVLSGKDITLRHMGNVI